MKQITKYVAIDGTEFNNENECLNYENLIKKVDLIMAELPFPKVDRLDFVNGGGFVQHDKKVLRKVQMNLLEEIKNHIHIDDENLSMSYVDRLILDSGISPLKKAWHRFMCVDELAREWGQPYYAKHPDKAKHVCVGGLNK